MDIHIVKIQYVHENDAIRYFKSQESAVRYMLSRVMTSTLQIVSMEIHQVYVEEG